MITANMSCDRNGRRDLLRTHRNASNQQEFYGLDYVEVADDGTTLTAFFIGKLPEALKSNQANKLNPYVRIEGGRRIRDIHVLDVEPHVEKDPLQDDALVIRVDKPGDFSQYTLRLVGLQDAGIDPFYDHADFSFKVDCPSDLDCGLPNACPPEPLDEPEINYLAKDYASFRQLILDRLALIMPDWKERHVPDLGITLVELLAYVGDHLSYYQDSVATESYLDTARQRISVRRHARLVDYFMHEGCNARTWLALSILGQPIYPLDLNNVTFFSVVDSNQGNVGEMVTPDEYRQLPPDSYEVFEPMVRTEVVLREARNEIHFYTWGERECCLPRRTTSASLLDGYVLSLTNGDGANPAGEKPSVVGNKAAQDVKQTPPENNADTKPTWDRSLNLQVGDVLLFEEVIGPKTGDPADADPTHRVAVRLTQVSLNQDPLTTVTVNDGEQDVVLPTPVVDIEWQPEDALPFALCLSSVSTPPDCVYLEDVSVARGNVILVDHGRTLQPENTGMVPLAQFDAQCECGGRTTEVAYLASPFNPALKHPGLTYRQALASDDLVHHKWVSAASLIRQDPRSALPQIYLNEVPGAPGRLQSLFTLDDLADPSDLIKRMRDPQDAYGAILLGKLTLKTQYSLEHLKDGEDPPLSLLQEVTNDLTALLRTWEPRFDLLNSGPEELHFVVEMDNNMVAHLRFGNHDLGEQPPAGSTFYAFYRVGNGQRGNVGAEAISHTVIELDGASLHVRNPLPAVGGVEPEAMSEVKLHAPFAFRTHRERAIIAEDYAEIAQREFSTDLQGAAANLTWSGSWYEAEVALDPFNAETESVKMEQDISWVLEAYRRMGHDLRVEQAHYVPLDIELEVCVAPDYLRGHVKAALLDLFSNRVLPDGKTGFFHPDRLVFGEDIYLSRLVAEAQKVEGVLSVKVNKLQRLFENPDQELQNGVLLLGSFEIAQLDNDPDYPEHGQFRLVMTGGR